MAACRGHKREANLEAQEAFNTCSAAMALSTCRLLPEQRGQLSPPPPSRVPALTVTGTQRLALATAHGNAVKCLLNGIILLYVESKQSNNNNNNTDCGPAVGPEVNISPGERTPARQPLLA